MCVSLFTVDNLFPEVHIRAYVHKLSEPAVGPCLCDLASCLVRKLQGTEAKVSGPDVQKNNNA
jgi:hypothetical protein